MNNNFLPPDKQHNPQEPPGHYTGLLRGGYQGPVPARQPSALPQQSVPSPLPPTNMTQEVQQSQHIQQAFTGNMPGNFGQPAQLPPQRAQQWQGPGVIARPMQMVRRLSNKMVAMRQPVPAVDPNPLVRYRGPQPPVPISQKPPVTRSQPWKRSRTQKINYIMRRRRERWLHNGTNKKKLGMIVTYVLSGLLLLTLIAGGISSYAYYQN